jgi:hypothetical protein
MSYDIPMNPRFNPMVNPQTGRPPYINTIPQNQSILSAFGFSGQPNPMMPQQSSSGIFGNMFGNVGNQPVNPMAITQQLQMNGLPYDIAQNAAEMVDTTTKLETALSQTAPNLSSAQREKIALAVATEKMEDNDPIKTGQVMRRPVIGQGMTSSGTYGPGAPFRQRMVPRGTYGPGDSIGNTGMSIEQYPSRSYAVMGGKRRRRTRRRMQRGGYSMSTFSNDAAPITGGRRKSRRHRRRTHKKHGKRSHRR